MRSDFIAAKPDARLASRAVRGHCLIYLLFFLAFFILTHTGQADATSRFHKEVRPILSKFCYDCHGDGMDKGGLAFDQLSNDDLLKKREIWSKVLKNLRAGLMPPEKKPRPSAEDIQQIESWVKYDAFGINPKNPDPGRVTLRRLNRVEYRNTIRDLAGIDFKADEEFPPDDSGYGFDNIGDVLTVSPLLLEKYMQAAETIVAAAVSTFPKSVKEETIPGKEFRGPNAKGEKMSFYKEATVSRGFKVEQPGEYHLIIELDVVGEFDFDPGRCKVRFKLDERDLAEKEFSWYNNKRFRYSFDEQWQPGSHALAFELQPLTERGEKTNALDLRIAAVKVVGPLAREHWVRTKNYDRFFSRGEPPQSRSERRKYAREVLVKFATKAFRRPVDSKTIDRLVPIAEEFYTQPGKRFEEGIGRAFVAVLSSPRFVFRTEENAPGPSHGPFSPVDEFALATRLSYFLWSTMPDEELFRLAERGELRKNVSGQLNRMLADSRSDALVQNFTGQWLQARDIEGIDINARVVLARDNGEEKELRRRFEEFRASLTNQNQQVKADGEKRRNFNRQRFFSKPKVELDRDLRRAMQLETEMFFAHIMREDRSVLEMIDSDYTFLNEKLASLYGIPNVTGEKMRRVTLPKESPRGGLLTEGTVLVVTSNPTRTSPVKRGLFLLENIIGTPTPPPPADVPLLEEAEKQFKDREPTLREVLELHRSKTLCSSCHSRMDPLGLALENFNALGMWREKERAQTIDTVGKLITGEPFHNIRELKQILKANHRLDFYRCLTEKLLTYALGRGLEYYDVETVDQIVARLEKENGRSLALLTGIIESAPFQKRRNTSAVTAEARPQSQKEAKLQRGNGLKPALQRTELQP